MIIGAMLHIFQQFACVNALISKMSPILSKSGLNIDSAYQATIATSAECFAGLVSTFLVDKLGRHLFWITSSSWCCIFMALFATNLITNWSVASIFLACSCLAEDLR